MTREYHEGYQQGYKDAKEEFKEPTTKNDLGVDCISRQAVMDCFKKWQPYMATRLWDFEQELSNLPSVTPQEPRKGHWISRPHIYGVAFCSECGFEIKINNTNYCPNCGCRMVEPQESEG